MHIPSVCIVSICIFLSISLASASSVMVIVFEQSDRTMLIPDAIIYADGKIAGKTDINGAFNLSFEGIHPDVRVAKGGYTDWTGSPANNDTAILVPMQVRNSTLHVEVFDGDTLLPIRDAHVTVTRDDGVQTDGMTGYDGKVDLPLRSDQVYTLEIGAQGFSPINDTIVTGGESSLVQYPLVKSDRISIRVSDSAVGQPVPSAQIKIDGAVNGYTNDKGVLISNTSRNVEHIFDISADGFEPAHLLKTISFEDQVVEFPLDRAKTTVFVSVYNRDQKPIAGAKVQMDGAYVGDTNEYGRLMLPSLEMKTYEFRVTHEGYLEKTLSYTSGNETGEVIIPLDSQYVDLLVFASDSEGNPLNNVSLFLLGEDQETLSTNETKSDGCAVLPAIDGKDYRIKAEKGGYYPNTTAANAQTNPNQVILHAPNSAYSGPGEGGPDLFFVAGIGFVIVLIVGIGIVFFGSRRRPPRRRGRSNRRRSL